MDKRAIRTPAGAKEIIRYNRDILYHLPEKYIYLNRALKNIKHDLLGLLKFCDSNEPIIWEQKYVWFIDNRRLTTTVRKKTTESVSNRHFNFLCCLGAVNKLKQTENNMTAVNMTFLLNERENGKIRPINTFTIYKYTVARLKEMDQRAAELLDHKITPGNISNDKLIASGCDHLAKEVYFANSTQSIHHKRLEFQELLQQLEKLCDEKGYTDKKEICRCIGWKKEKLDSLMNIFKQDWQQMYQYKAPNRADTERYGLRSKKWIITRREEKWEQKT